MKIKIETPSQARTKIQKDKEINYNDLPSIGFNCPKCKAEMYEEDGLDGLACAACGYIAKNQKTIKH